MKPIWYLDVDGVINMGYPSRPHDVPEECFRDEQIMGLPIRWDTRVVDKINDWHRRGLVEMVWLTTWEQDAIDHLAPGVGLDVFRCPTRSMRDEPEGPTGWWKFMSVLHHEVEDKLDQRAVIWTDDDLSYGIKLDRWITDWHENRTEAGLTTLGISPRSSRGLTMAHMDEIQKVLEP